MDGGCGLTAGRLDRPAMLAARQCRFLFSACRPARADIAIGSGGALESRRLRRLPDASLLKRTEEGVCSDIDPYK